MRNSGSLQAADTGRRLDRYLDKQRYIKETRPRKFYGPIIPSPSGGIIVFGFWFFCTGACDYYSHLGYGTGSRNGVIILLVILLLIFLVYSQNRPSKITIYLW